MIKKTQQIGPISVWTEENSKAKPSATVYFNYQPIVIFNPNKINERRLAAIQLVELGHCNQKTAGKICGFHRNTVFKLLRTKRLLGVEALLKDDRGPKTPWKYVGKIRKTIKSIEIKPTPICSFPFYSLSRLELQDGCKQESYE